MFSRIHNRKNRSQKDKDVEASNAPPNGSGSSTSGEGDNIGEYPALERFISTYRDDRSKTDEDELKGKRKKPWWKFWKLSDEEIAAGAQESAIPDSWLETDITTGIHSEEVEERRKRTGWNELSAEKVNPIAQFLGYFTGPILYGEHSSIPRFNVGC